MQFCVLSFIIKIVKEATQTQHNREQKGSTNMKTRINKNNETIVITLDKSEASLVHCALWDAYRKTEDNLKYVAQDYYNMWSKLLDTICKIDEQ